LSILSTDVNFFILVFCFLNIFSHIPDHSSGLLHNLNTWCSNW